MTTLYFCYSMGTSSIIMLVTANAHSAILIKMTHMLDNTFQHKTTKSYFSYESSNTVEYRSKKQ